MVTPFVRSSGSRTKRLWRFIKEASRVDIAGGIGAPLAQKMTPSCWSRVPIYVHPSFYRALKLKYRLDVGEISRDGQVSIELRTCSLRQAVGILNPRSSGS